MAHRTRSTILTSLWLCLWPGLDALAQGAFTDFTVRAVVPEQCMVRAEDLDFGAYDPNTVSRSSSQLRVSCTIGVPFEITLSWGSSGQIGQRAMTRGSDSLPYQLYTDAALSQVWGDSPGAGTVRGVGSGGDQIFRIHGKIEQGHFVPDGTYTDSVVVTVYY